VSFHVINPFHNNETVEPHAPLKRILPELLLARIAPLPEILVESVKLKEKLRSHGLKALSYLPFIVKPDRPNNESVMQCCEEMEGTVVTAIRGEVLFVFCYSL